MSASLVLATRVWLEATGDVFLVRAPSETQLKLPAAAEHEALQTIFILLPAQFPDDQRTSASGSGTTALLQQQVADETARSAVATQGRSLGIPAHRRAGSGSAGSCTRPVAHAGAYVRRSVRARPGPSSIHFDVPWLSLRGKGLRGAQRATRTRNTPKDSVAAVYSPPVCSHRALDHQVQQRARGHPWLLNVS